MKRNRVRFSLGTILTLCLTITVIAGCLFVFGKIRGTNANARMDAQRVVGVVNQFINDPTNQPAAQSTGRRKKIEKGTAG